MDKYFAFDGFKLVLFLMPIQNIIDYFNYKVNDIQLAFFKKNQSISSLYILCSQIKTQIKLKIKKRGFMKKYKKQITKSGNKLNSFTFTKDIADHIKQSQEVDVTVYEPYKGKQKFILIVDVSKEGA